MIPNNLVLATDFVEEHKYRIYDFDTGEPGVLNWLLHHPDEADTAELLGGFFSCHVVSVFHIDGNDYVCPDEVSYEDEDYKIGYFILAY